MLNQPWYYSPFVNAQFKNGHMKILANETGGEVCWGAAGKVFLTLTEEGKGETPPPQADTG